MRITAEEFKRIEPLLPKQRGNVKHDNLKFLNALLYLGLQVERSAERVRQLELYIHEPLAKRGVLL